MVHAFTKDPAIYGEDAGYYTLFQVRFRSLGNDLPHDFYVSSWQRIHNSISTSSFLVSGHVLWFPSSPPFRTKSRFHIDSCAL
jgi:hypothetical protein